MKEQLGSGVEVVCQTVPAIRDSKSKSVRGFREPYTGKGDKSMYPKMQTMD